MNELSPEDLAYFIKCLLEPERHPLGRLFTISYLKGLVASYPHQRPDFARAFACLLLITDERPVAERLVRVLLDLRVKEAADYIQIAYEKGLLSPSFLGGWKKVQDRLAKAAPAAPVDLPSPDGDPDEFWRALLLGPSFSSAPALSRQSGNAPEANG